MAVKKKKGGGSKSCRKVPAKKTSFKRAGKRVKNYARKRAKKR